MIQNCYLILYVCCFFVIVVNYVTAPLIELKDTKWFFLLLLEFMYVNSCNRFIKLIVFRESVLFYFPAFSRAFGVDCTYTTLKSSERISVYWEENQKKWVATETKIYIENGTEKTIFHLSWLLIEPLADCSIRLSFS